MGLKRRTFVLLLLAAASPALAAPRRPLLTLDTSFAFPAHCDSGGCVEASQVDVTTFVARDGSVLKVTNAASRITRFASDVVEAQLSDAERQELLDALLESGIRWQGDCEMGGHEAPRGEEVWTFYAWNPGTYNRFRIHFVLRGTSGFPQCPAAVERMRTRAYAVLP